MTKRTLAATESRRPVLLTMKPAVVLALVLLLCFGPAGNEAQDRWRDERSSGPFVLHADFSLEPYLHVLGETEKLHRDVSDVLALPPVKEPIHLFLFETKATHHWYVKRYFPEAPYRRALYIKDGGPGMVIAYRNREWEIDVRHECTHALLHSALPMMPLWLDEGLAEYFEVSPGKRAYEHPHLASIKWRVRLWGTPELTHLEGIREMKDMSADDYRDGWAWVHFMFHGCPAALDELICYLRDIASHTPPGRLGDRLRRRIPELDEKFVEHFKKWKPTDRKP